MTIKSDQLQGYIEGVRIPISSIETQNTRNRLTAAKITIPVGSFVIPKMWANAFIQVTYIQDINNTRQEKLFFQGLCKNVVVYEAQNYVEVEADSVWESLNNNTTLDYTSPRRYGLRQLEDGIVMHIGSESGDVVIPELKSNTGYRLSERYYYLETQDVQKELGFNDPEALKLEFIAQKMPFAERYAYSFFEDIGYQNFLLTQCAVDRFNLLAKSKTRQQIDTENLKFIERIGYGFVEGRDFNRQNIEFKYRTQFDDAEQTSGVVRKEINGKASGVPTNLQDYAANDSRRKYLYFYKSRDRNWMDQVACERVLDFAEKIYSKFGVPIGVGDCSGPFENGSYKHLNRHETHNDGASADIVIEGIANSNAKGYTKEKAIQALDILINQVGTRAKAPSVYFQDFKVLNQGQFWSNPELKGMVKSVHGHTDHFHIFFVERFS